MGTNCWEQNLTIFSLVFHRSPTSKLPVLKPIKTMTLPSEPSTLLNRSVNFERKIWQKILTIFCRAHRSKYVSVLEHITIMAVLRRPSDHLNNFLSRFKNSFYWTIYRLIFARKFWHHKHNFFEEVLYQFFFSFEWAHSYVDPNLILINSLLDWKTLFVKRNLDIFFSTQNLTKRSSVFFLFFAILAKLSHVFRRTPISIFFLFSMMTSKSPSVWNLLKRWHS